MRMSICLLYTFTFGAGVLAMGQSRPPGHTAVSVYVPESQGRPGPSRVVLCPTPVEPTDLDVVAWKGTWRRCAGISIKSGD